MSFDYGQDVERDRRKTVHDDDSDTDELSDWSDPDTIEIEGAFVASSSSVTGSDPIRNQIVTTKSLYCDPEDDVQPGDRIKAAGHVYMVDAVPQADINPFTGSQPVLEIPLREVTG